MPNDRDPSPSQFPPELWCLCALSLLLNLWGNWFGLPGSWHPDELVSSAVGMARDSTLIPPIYLYGSLHYYLVLAVIIPTYLISDLLSVSVDGQKTLVYLAARTLAALFGAGCVALTYCLARALFDRTTALLSAMFVTSAVGMVVAAHFATVDIPMVFWMLASYWMAARVLAGGSARDYLLAGAFSGLAAATKYVGGISLLTLVVAHLLSGRRGQGKFLLLGIGAAAVAFALVNPALFFASCQYLEGFIKDNAFNTTVGTDKDTVVLMSVLSRLFDSLGIFYSVLAASGLFYVVVIAIYNRERRSIGFILLTLLFFWLLISNVHYVSTRHVLPMVPPLMIVAAKMVADLIRSSEGRRLGRACAYGLTGAALLYSALFTLAAEMKFTHDGRNLASAWLLQHVPPGTTIETTSYSPIIPDEHFAVERRPMLRNLNFELTNFKKNAIYETLYPVYLAYKAVAESIGWCESRAEHYLGWYEKADARSSLEIQSFDPSVEGLEARGPDLLVVSSLYYDRFERDSTSPDGRFFKRLFSGDTGYREIAEFRYRSSPWLDPKVEMMNPTIRIFQRASAAEGGGAEHEMRPAAAD